MNDLGDENEDMKPCENDMLTSPAAIRLMTDSCNLRMGSGAEGGESLGDSICPGPLALEAEVEGRLEGWINHACNQGPNLMYRPKRVLNELVVRDDGGHSSLTLTLTFRAVPSGLGNDLTRMGDKGVTLRECYALAE